MKDNSRAGRYQATKETYAGTKEERKAQKEAEMSIGIAEGIYRNQTDPWADAMKEFQAVIAAHNNGYVSPRPLKVWNATHGSSMPNVWWDEADKIEPSKPTKPNYPKVQTMKNLFSPAVPILLIGAPGVGKTASVQAHFDHAEVMLTSTLVEEDIAGLPYREGEYDYRTIPALFRRLHEADVAGKSTVLFLDELDKARRAVADTLLTLVASRKVGTATLPANTCIVAAANPPEFGGGDGISEAMQSRFSTLDYVPDVSGWAEWASNEFKGKPAHAIISAVQCGEMPIFEMTGEGLNRRVTTPRTIAMTLKALERFDGQEDNFEVLARGLLTPATASQVLHLVRHQQNDVLNKSVGAATRSAVKRSSTPPVRL